ncbi:MAG: hypothetical protein A2Y40_00010 [Candidatus Margulisbacteria bacterium GWF2_35_9]|nr:MAG: hypothetical protein A2Y40_00010 [Candidatus Margulisbacteria bacterium GWF2_35_9]
MPKHIQQKILTSILIFLITISIGIIGYKIIAPDQSILNALYMTVITLTTVGYGEIIDLSASPNGKIFTMVLILFGMGNLLYVVTTITSFFTDGNLQEMLRRNKMEKQINRLENHIIICGGGTICRKIIEELTCTERQFVLVSTDGDELSKLELEYKDLLYIKGDPSVNDTLVSAGIQSANGLITTLPDDRDNLLVIVSAKQLNNKIRIVSHAQNSESISKFKTLGVDSIISPNLIGGLRMVSEMIRPSVVSFLDVMLRETKGNTRFENVTIQAGSSLINKTLAQSDIRKQTGLLVVSIKKPNIKEFIYNPSPEEILTLNTVLIVIGSVSEVSKLRSLANC